MKSRVSMGASDLDELVADMRAHAIQVRVKNRRRINWLAEFRSRRYGEDDKFFPLDFDGKPWHRYQVAISRGELTAAGYEDFAASWYDRNAPDPWRHLKWGGEVPLWQWGNTPRSELFTRPNRAKFLENLADVLESSRSGL